MGRPTKLTPEIQAKIVKAIEAGNLLSTSAALSGVSERSFFEWMAKGKKGEGENYSQFAQLVIQARAKAEAKAIKAVTDAMGEKDRDGWRAGAWYLEHGFPGKYTKSERREISGPEGGPIRVAPQDLSDEELTAIIQGGKP